MRKQSLGLIEKDAAKGRINRREFMHHATVLGVGVASASALFTSARAATPKTGGSARVGVNSSGTSDSMDPTKFLSSGDFQRGFMAFNPLVAIDRKQGPTAALATSWEPTTPSGDEWRLELRQGVTFHNGKGFSSADVVYSLNRHLGPDSESPGKALLEQVTEIRPDGKHAVYFKLAAPNAELPMLLTQPQFVITPEGSDDFTDALSTTVGTGAYKLKEFRPGIISAWERNEDFWGDAWVDEWEVVALTDNTARMNALLGGDLDVANNVDLKLVGLIESTAGLRLVAHKSSGHLIMTMMTDREPGNNPDLRLAVKHLVPRKEIVTNAFKGFALVGNDHQVTPLDPMYCQAMEQRSYDPEKGKFYLKKAGINKIQLRTSSVAGPGALEAPLLLREAAKEAGLEVEIVTEPGDSYWSAVWMQKPLYVTSWNPRPTADLILTICNRSDAAWNETRWMNERFDELLVKARGELDQDKRLAMYCEMQEMLHDDGGVAMLGFFNYVEGLKDRIQGYEGHPAANMRNAFMMSEPWIA